MYWNKLWLLCIVVLPSKAQHLDRIEPLFDIKYEIATRSQNSLTKRHALLEPKKIEYNDHVQFTLKAYNTTFQLNLEPNFDLFHPDAVMHHQGGVSEKLSIHHVYKGHVTGGSWARILIRHDLMLLSNQPMIEGAFSYHGDLYHIKTTENYNLVKRSNDSHVDSTMIIYRDSDTSSTENKHQQCGFDNLLNKKADVLFQVTEEVALGGLLKKRFHDGCPTTKKINYMGAAADCTYVHYYKSRDAARIQIINNFNMASAIFEETFNIGLGLINITIMDPTCPTTPREPWNRECDANYALGDRLSDFSLWRSTMRHDGAGLWHLMTNCPTGLEVGLAWLKQLCNTGSNTQLAPSGQIQYVSGAGVSAITMDEWKVVAHEIGHGFGAIHDCTLDSCPDVDGQCCPLSSTQCDSSGTSYLMSSVSNTSAEKFSPCSINTICSAFPTIGTCLSDPQQHTIYQLNVCGNGIKELGEECDTGDLDTDCCDAKTCKLKKPAACEDTNDGCCDQCQIRSKGAVCRPAVTLCDIEESCTGESPTCPDDLYVQDGTTCGSDGDLLRCASGQCTSRDAQCLSRGFVMNITQSCLTNNQECQMLCNKPDGDKKCLLFTGNFMDGTPCGYSGSCHAGQCQHGGPILWLQENQHIAIPVIVVAFLLACTAAGFLIFWFGCWRCCAGYKEKKRRGLSLSENSKRLDEAFDSSEKILVEDGPSLHDQLPPCEQEKKNSSTSDSSSPTASFSSSFLTVVNNNIIDETVKTEKNG